MESIWKVLRKQNGKYDVFKDGMLHHSEVSVTSLEQQMSPHGVTGALWKELCSQLSTRGEGEVAVPPMPKFGLRM
jgi:hypothetical protein